MLLPFLALTMSIINLGLNFFLIDALQDRANMAARFVALDPTNVDGGKSMLLYGLSTPPGPSEVIVPPPSFMDLTESNVTVTRYDVGTPNDRIVLTINNAKLPLFVPGLAGHIVNKPVTATVPVEIP